MLVPKVPVGVGVQDYGFNRLLRRAVAYVAIIEEEKGGLLSYTPTMLKGLVGTWKRKKAGKWDLHCIHPGKRQVKTQELLEREQ